MKLSRLGEFGLIEKIRRIAPGGPGVLLGIGDDAAWVKAKTSSFLITSDLLIERVHFDFKWTSPYALGYKSLAVNLSDIAAMGGTPAYLILSVGIPIEFDAQVVEEFYRGVRSLALRSGVALVGGDTSASESFFVSVALVGHAPHRPIGRNGGKAGDDVYVTGNLGDSALALSLLRHRPRETKRRASSYLLSRHHFPTARVKAGTLLAREKLAKAMIDVSDGLLQDLGHLCKASNIGAVVWEDSLPLSRAYRSVAGREGTRFALTGGEDYELLFTARRRDRSRLEKLQHRLDVPITRIGRCVSSREGITVWNTEGEPRSIGVKGYNHFRFTS
jgi:thiamine-monophosphate kinase